MWTTSLTFIAFLLASPPSFRIDGQIHSPLRHRFGHATLQTNDGRNVKRTYVGRDGRFGFKDVPEGHYSIVVVMDKARDVRRGIEVDETLADSQGRVRTRIDITDAVRSAERLQVSVKKLAIPSAARREFRRALSVGYSPGEVQAHLENAIAIAPDYDDALNNLGTLFLRRGERARAIEMFERAVAANPNSFHAHVNLGGALILTEQFDRAIDENLKALELRPEDSLSRAQVGIALFHQRRLEEAIPYLMEAQRLDPYSAIAADLMLGQVYETQGDVAHALEAYELFLRNHPTHIAVRYAKSKINLLRSRQP
jgi:tetratricopeptide (TPR) repeat protein